MTNAEKRKQLSDELSTIRNREKVIRESFPEDLACCAPDCFEDAVWVRSTQFSGDHPYCDIHAKQESNFGQEDASYFYWDTISEFLGLLEFRRKREDK